MNNYKIRETHEQMCEKIIFKLYEFIDLAGGEMLDKRRVEKIRNQITKEFQSTPPRNIELVQAYQKLVDEEIIEPNDFVLNHIIKRRVRTLSGIANITVMLKAFGCPGKCIFCPSQPGMPKSYFSNQPAMLRAVRNDFNAYMQVKARLNGLKAQGHDITKIDVRTAGGTWSSYLDDYQEHFIKSIYYALNEGTGEMQDIEKVNQDLENISLEKLIEINETAESRCVGLWIETRPDWVTEKELTKLRRFGVTGIELGIQTTNDEVNEFNERGHGLKESIVATNLSRQVGLKVCHHLMPNLPKSNMESDLKTIHDTYENKGLKPDYIKIYPCMVVPYTKLAEMVKEDPSIYTPYTDEELYQILKQTKLIVPKYCRIIRILRDFPSDLVLKGSKTLNMRQLLAKEGVKCQCIRCREIKGETIEENDTKINNLVYETDTGIENFITVDTIKTDKLIGLVRLHLPKKEIKNNQFLEELNGCALIRELHVYGQQKTLNENYKLKSHSQHKGYGKMLMHKAEEEAKSKGFKKVAVISAIGTREYYKKLGYKKIGTYMIKEI